MKLRNLSERLGCLSLRSALASIWRMRSRVTSNCLPTSSSVWSLVISMPKRIRSTLASRGVRPSRMSLTTSRRPACIAASIWGGLVASPLKKPPGGAGWGEDVFDEVAQAGLHRGFYRGGVARVLDEIAQVAVVVVPDRGFHRDRLFGDLHDLADLVLGYLHFGGQQRGIGLEAELLQVLAADAVHLVDGLYHVHRDADGARLVGDRARNGLADPPGGVGRKFVAAAVFEFVHGLHQADVALLYQVQELQATVGVLLGNRDHQAQVGFDHFLFGIARGGLAFIHALVDDLELGQRHHHARLQVHQLLLQILDRRDVARNDRRPGLAHGRLLFHPLQVQQVGREILDEGFLRHAAFVHDDAAQLAFFAAHIIDLAAHHVAQFFDGLGGKAYGHQLGRQGLLGLHVGQRALAVLFVDLVHFLEQIAQFVKAFQGLLFEFFELFGQRLGAALAVVVIGFVKFVEVFFGHVVVGLVGVGKAIDDARDHDLACADFLAHVQYFGDGGWRRAGRLHHRHQAAFDALGDFDLAFAREQFHGAHLAHVHANRVGGAAELAVDGRQGRFGGLFGLFFAGAGGGIVGNDQRFGIGRLLVDGHAQVVQRGDDGFQRFGIDQFVGQVVGNLDMGQVAARLAQFDQGLQARTAPGQVFLGQNGLVQAELLHQRAFLGLADLHAQRFDLLDRNRRFGNLLDLAFQVCFYIGQVDVVTARGRRHGAARVGTLVAGKLWLGVALGGGRLGCSRSRSSSSGGGSRGRGFFRWSVSGRGGRFAGAGGLAFGQVVGGFGRSDFCLLGSIFHGHGFDGLGGRCRRGGGGLFACGLRGRRGRLGSRGGRRLRGGAWSRFGRLCRLFSGHGPTSKSKTDTWKTSTGRRRRHRYRRGWQRAASRSARFAGGPARGLGDHWVCSPCAGGGSVVSQWWAFVRRFSRRPGVGAASVALADDKPCIVPSSTSGVLSDGGAPAGPGRVPGRRQGRSKLQARPIPQALCSHSRWRTAAPERTRSSTRLLSHSAAVWSAKWRACNMSKYGVACAQRLSSAMVICCHASNLYLSSTLAAYSACLVGLRTKPSRRRRAPSSARGASANTGPWPGITTRGARASIRSSVAATSANAAPPPASSGNTTPKPFSQSASADSRMRCCGSNSTTECGSCPGAACICQGRLPSSTQESGVSSVSKRNGGHSWPVGV